MKTRLISGTCYVLLLAAFFCMKLFLPYGAFYFDFLLYAFAAIGTFEMVRALKEKLTRAEIGVVYAFCGVCLPACAIAEEFLGSGFAALAICMFALCVALLSLLVIRHEETSLESVGLGLLSGMYPTVFLSVLSLMNHETAPASLTWLGLDSRILILFVFVVSPCSDSIAYVFGRAFGKKFPKKMAPTLSPKKTVVGGIGGLVGGLAGAAALYFIYNAIAGSYAQMYLWLPVYLLIGLVASVATMFGDLVESCIKRKVGLKDMGNIMPGHGGALDRLDSTFFSEIAVYAAFALISLFA